MTSPSASAMKMVTAFMREWELPEKCDEDGARIMSLELAGLIDKALTEEERENVEFARNLSGYARHGIKQTIDTLLAIIDRLSRSRPSPGVQAISGGSAVTAGQPEGSAGQEER